MNSKSMSDSIPEGNRAAHTPGRSKLTPEQRKERNAFRLQFRKDVAAAIAARAALAKGEA